MKTKPQMLVFAGSCFLAGFITCYYLTRQPHSKPAPIPALATTTPTAVGMLTLATVTTQVIQIDGGSWYQWPDGSMQRTAPPERVGYYDLIDIRAQKSRPL